MEKLKKEQKPTPQTPERAHTAPGTGKTMREHWTDLLRTVPWVPLPKKKTSVTHCCAEGAQAAAHAQPAAPAPRQHGEEAAGLPATDAACVVLLAGDDGAGMVFVHPPPDPSLPRDIQQLCHRWPRSWLKSPVSLPPNNSHIKCSLTHKFW